MDTNSKEVVEIDTRDLIMDHLNSDERDLAWLQRKTGIHYSTLYSCFVQRLFKVSDENLKKINEATGQNFKN